MGRAAFLTFGCKVNQYDTQAIREQLVWRGYQIVSPSDAPDVVVINTCSVTGASDAKARSMVRRVHRMQPQTSIVITGCSSDQAEAQWARLPGVRLVVGNDHKHQLGELIVSLKPSEPARHISSPRSRKHRRQFVPLQVSGLHGHARAFIKIQDGCDKFCTFCKIPLVRGPARSRPLNEIIDEAERLAAAGHREVVIAGVCLGFYGDELRPRRTLVDVLKRLHSVQGIERIRLSSLEPDRVSEDLICAIAASSKICHHLHLPLQSGDSGVLRNMRRGYTREDYLQLVERLRSKIPNLSLSMDVIIGFPGEDEAAHTMTRQLIWTTQPMRLHLFPYSPRESTRAARERALAPEPHVVRARMQELTQIGHLLAFEQRKSLVGSVQRVLLEGQAGTDRTQWSGYTDGYHRVIVVGAQSATGGLVDVQIVGADEVEMTGNLVESNNGYKSLK